MDYPVRTTSMRGVQPSLTTDRHYHSSSCAVRSAVSQSSATRYAITTSNDHAALCYNITPKSEIDAKLMRQGEIVFVRSLPYGGKNYKSALLPEDLHIQ